MSINFEEGEVKSYCCVKISKIKKVNIVNSDIFLTNFVVKECSLRFVKNDVKKRDSLVSKSLPVKFFTLVSCFFSA